MNQAFNLDALIAWIEHLATTLPLELFVIVGSFLEELIAPIPSPLVMMLAGAAGIEQQYTVVQFAVVVVLGAVAKTVASVLIYTAADTAEDVVVSKFGKYFGASHKQIENLGKLFGRGWWDDVLLFFLRAIPVVPSLLVSVLSGVLKINMQVYVITTLLGSIVRNILYLLLGVYGVQSFAELLVHLENFAAVVGAGVVIVGLYAVVQFIRKQALRFIRKRTKKI